LATITLYSAPSCPYAQRTRLALHEKNLEFELVEIDLKQTPDWFLDLSPTGKVPLLLHDDDRVWESSAINEYLEERHPEPALMPTTPLARARVRIEVDYANTTFAPLYYKLLLAETTARRKQVAERLDTALREMERNGPGAGGPWWLGDLFTLADVAFYPFFERFPVLANYRNFILPDDCSGVARWLDAIRDRASIKAHSRPAEFYIDAYAHYADGTADGRTAQEMREA
jgi:glutathione S-transferase